MRLILRQKRTRCYPFWEGILKDPVGGGNIFTILCSSSTHILELDLKSRSDFPIDCDRWIQVFSLFHNINPIINHNNAWNKPEIRLFSMIEQDWRRANKGKGRISLFLDVFASEVFQMPSEMWLKRIKLVSKLVFWTQTRE